MRNTLKLFMLMPVVAALSLAGPPSNGHSSGGQSSGRASVAGHAAVHSGTPLSGPAPLGASGPAPLNAAGSLRPVYGSSGAGRRFPNGARGGRYPFAYYSGPFALPYLGYGYDGGYSDSGDYGPAPDYGGPGGDDTQAMMMNQDALGRQVQQLTAEIQDMRNQQQVGLQPMPQSGPTAAPKPADADVQNEVPVTVVLRSGQQLNVKNYAVTDGVFWNFSKQPAQKIPVSAIDVAASQKATQANGGDFPPIAQ